MILACMRSDLLGLKYILKVENLKTRITFHLDNLNIVKITSNDLVKIYLVVDIVLGLRILIYIFFFLYNLFAFF